MFFSDESVSDEQAEAFYDDETAWPHALTALLHGSLAGGDPASRTGLLAGVAPMLLHQSASPHPERPARIVAIYHALLQQECKIFTRDHRAK